MDSGADMKITHFLLLAVALVWFDKRNQNANAYANTSAVDRVYSAEAATFGQMNGTNFTASVWDAQSGMPGYMFGAVPAPGGAGVMGTYDNTNVSMVGHL
jgi:hypothetical protein